MIKIKSWWMILNLKIYLTLQNNDNGNDGEEVDKKKEAEAVAYGVEEEEEEDQEVEKKEVARLEEGVKQGENNSRSQIIDLVSITYYNYF